MYPYRWERASRHGRYFVARLLAYARVITSKGEHRTLPDHRLVIRLHHDVNAWKFVSFTMTYLTPAGPFETPQHG